MKALVVTRGAEGSDIYVGGSTLHVPVAKAQALVDPIAVKWKPEVDTACGADLANKVRTLFAKNAL